MGCSCSRVSEIEEWIIDEKMECLGVGGELGGREIYGLDDCLYLGNY